MISWRQTIAAALLIAFVSAMAVWFLEDFNRRQAVAAMRAEWSSFLADWPTQHEGG